MPKIALMLSVVISAYAQVSTNVIRGYHHLLMVPKLALMLFVVIIIHHLLIVLKIALILLALLSTVW